MAIDNLTGTTWYVPSGWTATAGYGSFSVNYSIDGVTDYNVTLSIGYNLNVTATANVICDRPLSGPAIEDISLTSSDSFTINITGGTDVDKPDLIEWLTTYGIQLKVTDLTNTTWVLNETVKGFSDTSFDISGNFYSIYTNSEDITARSIDNFTILDGTYGWCISITDNYGNNPSYHTYGGSSWYTRYYSTGVDYYEYKPTNAEDVLKLRTISITGGTDSTNPKLIAWLSKWGELEETPTTPHGEIYYKGNLVATLVEGETIVLHTKDFKFLGDIVIKNVGEVEEEIPKLSAPTISIDGNTLRITDTSGLAEGYFVYANGELSFGVANRVDAIDLSGYINVLGTYSITVEAYAEGYKQSESSNAVEYVVNGTGGSDD